MIDYDKIEVDQNSYYSIQEVSDKTGISYGALLYNIKTGKIPAVRVLNKYAIKGQTIYTHIIKLTKI